MIIKVTRIPATENAYGSIIMLHGLGNSGLAFKNFPELINDPHLNYIFPDTSINPVTFTGQKANYDLQLKSMWFDVLGLEGREVKHDEKMFWESVSEVEDLIRQEVNRGIPSNRIIVGGFSQGGSIALGVGIDLDMKLGGIVCFGAFLTTRKEVDNRLKSANFGTDILHTHNDHDPMIPKRYAKSCYQFLNLLGFRNYHLKFYNGNRHAIEKEQLEDATEFIRAHYKTI